MNFNLHGRGRAKCEFHGHLLDSPYIYDIYDTNDGDSMKFMTQVIYEA